ncbi:hypothetical protein OUZ56_025510 [Daphnia magna]|uniref:Uncharacterized protein n=1 Tax=Daphnia magna TaxID=35525 RepID=A0ABQ9ZK28_9CRUS|nr:hypothetical protein OUZ56_025510 [Daphnia magna]
MLAALANRLLAVPAPALVAAPAPAVAIAAVRAIFRQVPPRLVTASQLLRTESRYKFIVQEGAYVARRNWSKPSAMGPGASHGGGAKTAAERIGMDK